MPVKKEDGSVHAIDGEADPDVRISWHYPDDNDPIECIFTGDFTPKEKKRWSDHREDVIRILNAKRRQLSTFDANN